MGNTNCVHIVENINYGWTFQSYIGDMSIRGLKKSDLKTIICFKKNQKIQGRSIRNSKITKLGKKKNSKDEIRNTLLKHVSTSL